MKKLKPFELVKTLVWNVYMGPISPSRMPVWIIGVDESDDKGRKRCSVFPSCKGVTMMLRWFLHLEDKPEESSRFYLVNVEV